MSEDEIRQALTRTAILMRRNQRLRRELDTKWQELVATRIELQHRLDQFEVYHAENPD